MWGFQFFTDFLDIANETGHEYGGGTILILIFL